MLSSVAVCRYFIRILLGETTDKKGQRISICTDLLLISAMKNPNAFCDHFIKILWCAFLPLRSIRPFAPKSSSVTS